MFFLFVVSFLSVQCLDIKADIFALPFHKLSFSSTPPPLGQDLITVKVISHDLKCHVQHPKATSHDDQKVDEEPDNILETALEAAGRMACLQWDLGMWTYEWCPEKGISQFHHITEKGVVLKYDLGNKLLNQELRTVNDTHSFAFASITLGSGTRCDVTGEPRSTEVQFHCKQDINDYISKVVEVSTCKYVAVIHSSKICDVSPRFIPKTALEETLITCYGSPIDGYVPSFFEEETQEEVVVQEKEQEQEQEKEQEKDSLLEVTKKLLEQSGFSLEILNVDQVLLQQ